MSNPVKNVAVLKGGISAEREVSLRTGAGVAHALGSIGYFVTEVDVVSKEFLLPEGTEFAFISLHGTFGEDGELQQILENKGVPYNGSGPEASRTAFEKMEAKARFEGAGLPTARAAVWKPGMEWKTPYVLKPVAQGSSVGVFRVFSDGDSAQASEEAAEMGCEFMIEEMIVGAEFTVGVLGDEALPSIEIRPEGGFYDYQHKYTAGATRYLCPAPIPADLEKRLRELAVKAHRSLGCEVYSRVDFIVNADQEPYVLEVNTIPGMTETSLLPKAAAQAGMNYAQLCDRILKLSLEKKA